MSRSPIWVSDYTKNCLKSVALSSKESYENILVRLLDCKCIDLKCDYQVSLGEGVSVRLCVDWGAFSENLSFYDGDVLVDAFPGCPVGVSDDVWQGFREAFFGVDDIFSVLAVLDADCCTRVNGLLFCGL